MQITTDKENSDILTVKIEKLSNLGYGIAHADGLVVFIPNTCPDDIAKIRITNKKKNYANALLVEIVEPSKSRVEPFCKLQKVCGACQLQFIDYKAQLKYKKEIVEDTIKSIYGSQLEVRDVIPSPEEKGYRHKIQYPIGQTKESKRILAGYYKQNSHELVNIKYCPIQPEYCDNIIEFIRVKAQKLGITGYSEKNHNGELRHVVIRTSAMNGKSLVIMVVNSNKVSEEIKTLAEKIYNELPNINGVGVNFNDKKTNLIMGAKTSILYGNNYIKEKLCDKVFKVGAKTFFQVNPKSADNIFQYVKNYIKNNFENPVILDAYAGITAFGICLSDAAKTVVSVEEVEESVSLAKRIIDENNIKNVELNCSDAGKFFEKEYNSGKKFDVTVLDPPRKGCTEESLNYALKLTKSTIIYVSCNPATLARDLLHLKNNGAKIDYIQPVDMFPHTYHIENIAVIRLNN